MSPLRVEKGTPEEYKDWHAPQSRPSAEVDAFTFIEQKRAEAEKATETKPALQITPDMVERAFGQLGSLEKNHVEDDDDETFARFAAGVKVINPKRANLLSAVRKLTRREVDSGQSPPARPKTLIPTSDKARTEVESESEIDATIIPGVHSWESGLRAAKNLHGEAIRYPTEAEAQNLLRLIKKDYPNSAVAVFINETGTYFYLSKTGEHSGKITSERAPDDTILLTMVVPENAQRLAA